MFKMTPAIILALLCSHVLSMSGSDALNFVPYYIGEQDEKWLNVMANVEREGLKYIPSNPGINFDVFLKGFIAILDERIDTRVSSSIIHNQVIADCGVKHWKKEKTSKIEMMKLGLEAFKEKRYQDAISFISEAIRRNGCSLFDRPALGEDLYILSQMYMISGIDEKKGLALFRCSASMGYGPAIFSLGLEYLTGDGTKEELSKASNWFSKSPKETISIYYRGLALINHCPKRKHLSGQKAWMGPVLALRLIRKAALQGYPAAMNFYKLFRDSSEDSGFFYEVQRR